MRKIFWCFVIMSVWIAAPAFAQDATPTLTPTPGLSLPTGGITDALEDAGDAAEGLPDSIGAPGGTSLFPNVNFGVAFSYLKWLVSPPAADELAGPFGRIIADLGILLAAQMIYLGVYGAVYFVSYALRWGWWIFQLVATVLQLITALINSVIGKFIGLLGL